MRINLQCPNWMLSSCIDHSVSFLSWCWIRIVRLAFPDCVCAFGPLDRRAFPQILSENFLNVFWDCLCNCTLFNSFAKNGAPLSPVTSGIFQGAVPPISFLHLCLQAPYSSSFISCEYANNAVFGCSYNVRGSISHLDDNLNDLIDWSFSHSL